jgi:site-specific recombinase XerD
MMDATAGWIRDQNSRDTRDAYRRDVTGIQPDGQTPARLKMPAWLTWCQAHGLDPLEVRVRHVSAYARQLEADGFSPATRARKLSAISSWYDYLMREDITERNPAKIVKRPVIDKSVSNATGLSEGEIDALLDAAEADGPRSAALFSLLYFGSFRIGSVLNATVGDLGWDQGERTLRLTVKGGAVRRPTLEPEAVAALDAYLASRGQPGPSEPLLLADEGGKLSKQSAWRTMRRLARQAGIKSWAQLNPHSLRHSHITHALDHDVPLDEVRETAGHKSEDTTRRYDRARQRRAARSGRVLSERRAKLKAERGAS